MLLTIPDKQALWQNILAEAESAIEPGVFYMLLDRCYIDRFEKGEVIIVAPSYTLQATIERKALRVLEQVILKEATSPLRVKVTVAQKRLFPTSQTSKASNTALTVHQKLEQAAEIGIEDLHDEKAALTRLHASYGDIMGIVDHHPLFVKACAPIQQGGWGIFPQLLTNACKDFGVITVLKAIQAAQLPKVKNPRAFFLQRLSAGDFGYRLARGADILGHS